MGEEFSVNIQLLGFQISIRNMGLVLSLTYLMKLFYSAFVSADVDCIALCAWLTVLLPRCCVPALESGMLSIAWPSSRCFSSLIVMAFMNSLCMFNIHDMGGEFLFQHVI